MLRTLKEVTAAYLVPTPWIYPERISSLIHTHRDDTGLSHVRNTGRSHGCPVILALVVSVQRDAWGCRCSSESSPGYQDAILTWFPWLVFRIPEAESTIIRGGGIWVRGFVRTSQKNVKFPVTDFAENFTDHSFQGWKKSFPCCSQIHGKVLAY